MSRGIRVTVRGAFDSLSPGQRETLLASAADHDFLNTSYTPEGYLAYDVAARPFFTFRYLIEAADDEDLDVTATRGELLAVEWLDTHGYGYKNLTAAAVDPAEVPLGARGRRTAAKNH
ncbi:hypothetical protein J2S43_002390 [Catenuloplanes nepalensis]|uniref:Uncharacterized protein n=1 Tax=Catenuloplanes nepalensis TaxID=587533 RepID=A0ABT9MRH6_9ACTN|nr:DUF6204 family protein [Catenuloplanes nepalensis]MDP9793878.1 hypothetical protein [Catenuloplanes nepalensis]